MSYSKVDAVIAQLLAIVAAASPDLGKISGSAGADEEPVAISQTVLGQHLTRLRTHRLVNGDTEHQSVDLTAASPAISALVNSLKKLS